MNSVSVLHVSLAQQAVHGCAKSGEYFTLARLLADPKRFDGATTRTEYTQFRID